MGLRAKVMWSSRTHTLSVNGPAPTGRWGKFAPSFWIAAVDAMKVGFCATALSNWVFGPGSVMRRVWACTTSVRRSFAAVYWRDFVAGFACRS